MMPGYQHIDSKCECLVPLFTSFLHLSDPLDVPIHDHLFASLDHVPALSTQYTLHDVNNDPDTLFLRIPSIITILLLTLFVRCLALFTAILIYDLPFNLLVQRSSLGISAYQIHASLDEPALTVLLPYQILLC